MYSPYYSLELSVFFYVFTLVECLVTTRGAEYRGKRSHTSHDRPCQRWDIQQLHTIDNFRRPSLLSIQWNLTSKKTSQLQSPWLSPKLYSTVQVTPCNMVTSPLRSLLPSPVGDLNSEVPLYCVLTVLIVLVDSFFHVLSLFCFLSIAFN